MLNNDVSKLIDEFIGYVPKDKQFFLYLNKENIIDLINKRGEDFTAKSIAKAMFQFISDTPLTTVTPDELSSDLSENPEFLFRSFLLDALPDGNPQHFCARQLSFIYSTTELMNMFFSNSKDLLSAINQDENYQRISPFLFSCIRNYYIGNMDGVIPNDTLLNLQDSLTQLWNNKLENTSFDDRDSVIKTIYEYRNFKKAFENLFDCSDFNIGDYIYTSSNLALSSLNGHYKEVENSLSLHLSQKLPCYDNLTPISKNMHREIISDLINSNYIFDNSDTLHINKLLKQDGSIYGYLLYKKTPNAEQKKDNISLISVCHVEDGYRIAFPTNVIPNWMLNSKPSTKGISNFISKNIVTGKIHLKSPTEGSLTLSPKEEKSFTTGLHSKSSNAKENPHSNYR